MPPGRTLRRTLRDTLVLTVVLAAIAVSCTSPQPEVDEELPPAPEQSEPPPALGASLGVVLPPAAGLADPEARDVDVQLQSLGIAAGPDITEVRTLRADAEVFVADLAALLADRDHDLVCVLGDGARAVVAAQADLHPEGRYCAAPSSSDVDPPPAITAVAMPYLAFGHLLGATAATAVVGGRVGVILDSGRTGVDDLRTGLLAGLGATDVVEVTITDRPTDDDTVPASVPEAVAAVVAAGAAVVVVDAPATAEAIDAVTQLAERVPVMSTSALLGDAASTALLAWRIRWDLVLRPVVDALLAGELGGITELGLADDVVEVALGTGAEPAIRARFETVREELVAGDRDPAEPDPTEPEPVTPEPTGPGDDGGPGVGPGDDGGPAA